ncbi:hypothetical protein [Pseudomonas putida]
MIISNSSNAALAAYANLAARNASTSTSSTADQANAANVQQVGGAVSLSGTSTSYSHAIARYAAYFPVREGMAADALVLSVSQPGAVSSSKGLGFADVADDARKRLDEKYALMTKSGRPYDGSDTDRNSAMGDLDRRSLYAVATNKGGQFSSEEQAAATALMKQQGRLATGYYSGPADQAKNFTDPYAKDPVGRAKAALAFLDNVSMEEKAGSGWLVQHQTLSDALTQTGSAASGSAVNGGKGHFHNLAEILTGVDTGAE